MASAPKREKRETKLPEIGGESTAKPGFPNQTPEKKKKKKNTMNTDIRKQGKESKNKHFHGEPKNPKQKGIKTKIKSKPIQQKNSRQSSISYPNLKKMEKDVPEPILMI